MNRNTEAFMSIDEAKKIITDKFGEEAAQTRPELILELMKIDGLNKIRNEIYDLTVVVENIDFKQE